MTSQKQTTNLPGMDTSAPGYIDIDFPAETNEKNGGYIDVFDESDVVKMEPEEQLPDLPEPVAEIQPIDDDEINQIKQVGVPETLSATPLGLEIGEELVLKPGTPSEGRNEQLAGKQKFLFEEYDRKAEKVFVDADGERLEFSRAEFENLFQLLPESISSGPAEAEEGSLKSYSFDLGGGAEEIKEQTSIAGTTNPIENEANTHLDIEVGQEWQDSDLGGLYIEKIVAADGKGNLGIKFKNTDEIREATAVWTEFFKQMTLGSETSAPKNGTGSNITREVEEKIDDLSIRVNKKIVVDSLPDVYEEGRKVQSEISERIPAVVTTESEIVIPADEAEAEKEVAEVVETAVPEVVEEERREDASDPDVTTTALPEGGSATEPTDSDRHTRFSADTKRPANTTDAAELEAAALTSDAEPADVENPGGSGET